MLQGRKCKPHHELYSQAKRREEALKRVREEKTKRQNAYRAGQLASMQDASQEVWNAQEEKTLTEQLKEGLHISEDISESERQYIELMQPQWMTEYPPNLATDWLVMARPEGRRCLVEASKGRTISRLKTGGILHTFSSSLPGGSSVMNGRTLLDCIFHEPDSRYYIMDLLCWNGVSVTDCEALFRLYWIRPKLMECTPSTDAPFTFEVPTVYECNEHGLLASLYDAVPFVRDGICLLHKEGHYIHGPSELSLLWKDLTCSRYLIETDMHGNPTEHQCITLRLGSDYKLYTGDDPPLQFCKLENCQLNDVMHPDKIQPGRLMKFHLEGDFDLQSPCLEFVGLVRNRRKQPDLFSKILFQRQAREGKIHSLELIQTVKHHG